MVQDWIKIAGHDVINVYGSTKIEKFLSNKDNTQHFTNFAFKLVQNLLLHRGKESQGKKVSQKLCSTILTHLQSSNEFFTDKSL